MDDEDADLGEIPAAEVEQIREDVPARRYPTRRRRRRKQFPIVGPDTMKPKKATPTNLAGAIQDLLPIYTRLTAEVMLGGLASRDVNGAHLGYHLARRTLHMLSVVNSQQLALTNAQSYMSTLIQPSMLRDLQATAELAHLVSKTQHFIGQADLGRYVASLTARGVALSLDSVRTIAAVIGSLGSTPASMHRPKWSSVDEKLLICAMMRYGRRWDVIHREYFPGMNLGTLRQKFTTLTGPTAPSSVMKEARLTMHAMQQRHSSWTAEEEAALRATLDDTPPGRKNWEDIRKRMMEALEVDETSDKASRYRVSYLKWRFAKIGLDAHKGPTPDNSPG